MSAQIKTGQIETVQVNLAERSYSIHVGSGLINTAGDYIAPYLKEARTIIVTDSNVEKHWLAPLQNSLNSHGISSEAIVMEPGEKTKNSIRLMHQEQKVRREPLKLARSGQQTSSRPNDPQQPLPILN